MDFFEADELRHTYLPPAIYTIKSITRKRGEVNHLHRDLLDCKAYPLFTNVGERGYICVIPVYDDRYHLISTSPIESFSPWGNSEDEVVIETENTTYVLSLYEEYI